MNRHGLIGFALGIVTAFSAAVLIAAEKKTPATSPAAAETTGPVGRYQVVHVATYANADECWVIDTTNGHLWLHSSGETTGSYRDQGMPPDLAK